MKGTSWILFFSDERIIDDVQTAFCLGAGVVSHRSHASVHPRLFVFFLQRGDGRVIRA